MNFKNRTLYAIDNLQVLRGMEKESIDLIYLDPPFNKKETFHQPLKADIIEDIQAFIRWFNAFNAKHEHALCKKVLKWRDDFEQLSFKDTWHSGTDIRNALGWSAELKESHPKVYQLLQYIQSIVAEDIHYKDHLAYLAFMAVRLVEMGRILKPTGSLYLHCDPSMSHWLKLLLDAIFGEKNFRNEIVWHYGGGTDRKKGFNKKHDIILLYSKSTDWYFHTIYEPFKASTLRRFDKEDEKGRYKVNRLKDGRVYRTYMKPEGKKVNDVWYINIIVRSHHEHVGYPTQKPLALLERIIRASSREGDIVLDPFCGCATTCIAAHKLNRGYVGIDISEASYILNIYRLYKEGFGWTKDGLFKEQGIGRLANYTPQFREKAPKRSITEPEKGGYIYIISNPAWPDQYKVGVAASPERRLKGYNTVASKQDYALAFQLACLNHREIAHSVYETFPNDYEWVAGELSELKDFIQAQAKNG